MTKRRKQKLDDNSTQRIDDEEERNLVNQEENNINFYNIAELSRNKLISFDLQKEILDDFKNIQRRNIFPCFSEISSTLHFTALNSRDIITSKKNYLNNHHISKSISLVNVLDELNNNKQHIVIQDNGYSSGKNKS